MSSPTKSDPIDGAEAGRDVIVGALVRVPEPDEHAFERRLRQVAARRRRLADLEAELTRLKEGIGRFEAVCRARVGGILADLRRVDASTADYRQRLDRLRNPDAPDPDPEPEPEPEPDEDHEEELGEADRVAANGRGGTTGEATSNGRASAGGGGEAEAKRLYRDLAKRCHPDFARDDAERERREAMMQRVNEAYRARDLGTLRDLRRETESEDPTFAQRPATERLAWAAAELERLDALLAAIKAEFDRLRGYELYRLWRRSEAGESVLDELEDDLEGRLRAKHRRLDSLIAAYLQARGEAPRRRRTRA